MQNVYVANLLSVYIRFIRHIRKYNRIRTDCLFFYWAKYCGNSKFDTSLSEVFRICFFFIDAMSIPHLSDHSKSCSRRFTASQKKKKKEKARPIQIWKHA